MADNPNELVDSLNNSYIDSNNELTTANINNNISQEILLKQEQLLKMENEKLNNQLYNLDQIQSIISNKDTMTKQTDQELSKKNNNINFLIFMLIIALLTFLVIMLGNQGVIDNFKMNAILGVLGFHVLIGLIIFYDLLYLGTAFKNMFYNRDNIMIDKLNNWKFASNIVNAVDTSLYGTEGDWQNANCQFPCNPQEEESTTVASYNNISNIPTPGYYYNDGTSPAQLLDPVPTYANTNNQKELIYWPDYDNSNKIVHKYNIQNRNIIDNPNDIEGKLTGNYTITSNL
jgi:hypothetical protein